MTMKKKIIGGIFALLIGVGCIAAQEQSQSNKNSKIDRNIKSEVFMPKGTFFAGTTLGYTRYSAEEYKFLLLDDISGYAKMFGARAFIGYTFANNVAAGLAFDYSYNVVQLDNVDISLGDDLNFNIEDSYSIQSVYTAEAFLRTYINLGSQKRFALYNDVRAYLGGGNGKTTSGASDSELYTGTFQKITKIGVSFVPGIIFFATDFFSIEAGVDILGIGYTRTEQTTNQVYQGYYESFDASFKLNLLSLQFGMSFYF